MHHTASIRSNLSTSLLSALDLVEHDDSAVEDAWLVVDATFLDHSRRQLFANAAIAASRVGSYPCVGVRSLWWS
jgi:hypothetical protein